MIRKLVLLCLFTLGLATLLPEYAAACHRGGGCCVSCCYPCCDTCCSPCCYPCCDNCHGCFALAANPCPHPGDPYSVLVWCPCCPHHVPTWTCAYVYRYHCYMCVWVYYIYPHGQTPRWEDENRRPGGEGGKPGGEGGKPGAEGGKPGAEGGKPSGEGGRKPGADEEAAAPARARLVVNLPEDATLTIDDNPTKSTSSRRVFVTPALEEGKTFSYTLKARVNRDGQAWAVTREVTVRAGEQTEISLGDAPVRVAAR